MYVKFLWTSPRVRPCFISFLLNSLSLLPLTNAVPFVAQGIQRFIVLFCRVYCTFLSGLLYFFIGSIDFFCRS
jgi:hypothetical protein